MMDLETDRNRWGGMEGKGREGLQLAMILFRVGPPTSSFLLAQRATLLLRTCGVGCGEGSGTGSAKSSKESRNQAK